MALPRLTLERVHTVYLGVPRDSYSNSDYFLIQQ